MVNSPLDQIAMFGIESRETYDKTREGKAFHEFYAHHALCRMQNEQIKLYKRQFEEEITREELFRCTQDILAFMIADICTGYGKTINESKDIYYSMQSQCISKINEHYDKENETLA